MMIRAMLPKDLPALQVISPPSVKPVVEFDVFPTLVALVDGVIAGYTQFTVTPDRVFHSMAIRVAPEFKGQGIGQALADARVGLGRDLGCVMHMAAVAAEGEEAMKKILLRQGLHLCRKLGPMWIYLGGFDDDNS
jgi:GNAT superfamily N-acetyltransferase